MYDAKTRKLVLLPPSRLKLANRNARTHSADQIAQLKRSLQRFGFTNPVLIDDEDRIVAGHGRVAAALEIGMEVVPCIRLADMSAADRRAYLIADNKLALNAGWDLEILADELGALDDIEFDLTVMGFDQIEIDAIFCERDEASTKPLPPEDILPAPSLHAVTRRGDMWLLGKHRLLCGDAKKENDMAVLMDGNRADMVFTDPPYNVPVAGHVSGMGRIKHREFLEASGEMSSPQFKAFLGAAFEVIERACRSGAIVFTCMDWRHLREVLEAGYGAFTELKNICVWSKTNGGMGSFYRSQHEHVLVWKVGDAPHINNFGLGDRGRHRTNIWSYPGVNSFGTDRLKDLALHPTVKPVAMVADAIRDVSHRGDLVLDPFGGSGTTLIAAQKVGRRANLMELDAVYCDVIIRRWQTMTGKMAVLAATTQTFDEAGRERLASTELAEQCK